MSGICGIINKSNDNSTVDFFNSLKLMVGKLGCLPSQPFALGQTGNVYWANVSLINDIENSNYIHNQDFDITCIIDGLVYVDAKIRTLIQNKYPVKSDSSDKALIPYLYKEYGAEFIAHLTGWYNLFLVDKNSSSAVLINDRLGYLPLFYYEDERVLLFASKIEAIIATGLLPTIEFDVVSITEHLFFNYVLSDHTFIKKIKTLNGASRIIVNKAVVTKDNYWHFRELLADKQGCRKDGLAQLDAGLKKAFSKPLNSISSKVNLSLTGGWDSRLVLSYLMPLKDKLHLYSFGATNSPDISIPETIALQEGLAYTPYLLNEAYLETQFHKNAQNTILLSNGTRNFKRTHYLYAIEQVSQHANTIISGIFGDEVLKIAGAKPGDVISKNALDFIGSNFDVEKSVATYRSSELWQFIAFEQSYLDEFRSRLNAVSNDVSAYLTLNQKYYHFRFMINLRKYFGAEANSYNDYCYNFSPFIDYDFLTAYFKSYYCGTFYPFNNNSLKVKRQTTILYAKLIECNYKKLLHYQTDRGYSMVDTLSFKGMVNIIIKHFIQKKSHNDSYNTLSTVPRFKEIVTLAQDGDALLPLSEKVLDTNNKDLISIYYWLQCVSFTYQR